MYKPNKQQREILSRTAGRKYRISRLEGRRSEAWYDYPLRGNQALPRTLLAFEKEKGGELHAVWLVHKTVNDEKCDCESVAPANEITTNADFSAITLTGKFGRLTYQEVP